MAASGSTATITFLEPLDGRIFKSVTATPEMEGQQEHSIGRRTDCLNEVARPCSTSLDYWSCEECSLRRGWNRTICHGIDDKGLNCTPALKISYSANTKMTNKTKVIRIINWHSTKHKI